MYKKSFCIIIIAALIAAILTSCSAITESFVFGTFYSLDYRGQGSPTAKNETDKLFKTLENDFSTSVADSYVSQINDAEANMPVSVSKEFAEIFKTLQKLNSKIPEFNPAVFPLIELWRFSPNSYTGIAESLPTDNQITQTLKYSTLDCFCLDEDSLTIQKTDSRAKLDFGAYLKGYATDCAANTAKNTQYVVNVGGTIKTNKELTVGIQNPRGNGNVATFTLNNASCATSGDYERCYFVNDIRYAHIIGLNGMPSNLSNNVTSVTVVGNSAAYADALSTVLFIKGIEGFELLKTEFPEYSAIIFTEDSYYTYGETVFSVREND